MSLLTLDSITIATPEGRRLASDLTLSFGRERTGIVGRNGSGKTTLLHVMAGEIEPAAGTVARSGRIELVQQYWTEPDRPVDVALGVAEKLAVVERLTSGRGSVDDSSAADWTIEERTHAALEHVGLKEEVLRRPLSSLSGGERTRVAIAKAVLAAPDLLLLDEPTNNLDADGRALIRQLVEQWKGGLVVASHDRDLLEHMDRIVEISSVECTVFGGGWSSFRLARDAARKRVEAEMERTRGEVRLIEQAAQKEREKKARRDKAGKAWRTKGIDNKMFLDAERARAERSAASGRRVSDRLIGEAQSAYDEVRHRVEVLTRLRIELPSSKVSSARELIRFDQVELSRRGRRILGPLSFEVRGPERIAIAGRNGSGKTSILRMVLGSLAPTEGTVWARRDRIAMLDQHTDFLNEDESAFENLLRLHPELPENAARAALAKFAFRNRDACQIVQTMSGGERLRLALACLLSTSPMPDLLLLDEPTNHLDMESTEILESALSSFDGALLVVSHDPAFLSAIGIQHTIELS